MRPCKPLVCALALAACGGGEVDGDNGQVSDELAGYCIATFTADHELLNPGGSVALRVEEGQRYLLTGLPDAPALVYQHRDGAFDLDLDEGSAPVDAPCLAGGAALTSEYVAFARLDVYSDQALKSRVCTIDKFSRGGAISYGYVADDVYELFLSGGFCDDLKSGFVRATQITIGDMSHIGVPILQLFRLQA